jgi:hypothetical protein
VELSEPKSNLGQIANDSIGSNTNEGNFKLPKNIVSDSSLKDSNLPKITAIKNTEFSQIVNGVTICLKRYSSENVLKYIDVLILFDKSVYTTDKYGCFIIPEEKVRKYGEYSLKEATIKFEGSIKVFNFGLSENQVISIKI